MNVKKIAHIAVNSKSIEKSRRFYCNILGLKEGKCVDMGDVVLHYLTLEDGGEIELFEMKDRTYYQTLSKKEGVIKHIAFEVDDVESINQKLEENKVPMELELCVLEPLQIKTLICKDPDGTLVEVYENIENKEI